MSGGFWNKLVSLDRRWIYLVIGMATFFPMLTSVDMPVKITSEVQSVYDRIESLPRGTVIMVPMEYFSGRSAQEWIFPPTIS